MKAVIVADIIKSTTFSVEQLMAIQEELKQYVDENIKWFKEHNSVFGGRVVRGDTLECYIDNPHYALRAALLLHLRMMLFLVLQNNISIKEKTTSSLRSGINLVGSLLSFGLAIMMAASILVLHQKGIL